MQSFVLFLDTVWEYLKLPRSVGSALSDIFLAVVLISAFAGLVKFFAVMEAWKTKRKGLNDNSRLRCWLLGGLLAVSSHSEVSAAVRIRIHNGTASGVYINPAWIGCSGSGNGGQSYGLLAAGATVMFSLPIGSYSGAGVQWGPGSGGPWYDAVLTDGSPGGYAATHNWACSNTGDYPADGQSFEVGAYTPPPATWCYNGWVRNWTQAPVVYEVYYNSSTGPAELQALLMVSPGNEMPFSVSDKSEAGYITVVEKPAAGAVYIGDGLYAESPETFHFVAGPMDGNWYNCLSTGTDKIIDHTAGQITMGTNNPIDWGNTNAGSVIDTNLATEGTLKTGMQALAGLNQALLNQLLNESRAHGKALTNISGKLDQIRAAITNNNNASQLGAMTNQLVGISNILRGMSNNMAMMTDTNGNLGTNWLTSKANDWKTKVDAYMGPLIAPITNGIADRAGVYSNIVAGAASSAGSHSVDSDFWKVQLPGMATISGGPSEIDFNPLGPSPIGTIANFTKALIAWISLLFAVSVIMRDAWTTVNAFGAISAPAPSTIGGSIPVASLGSGTVKVIWALGVIIGFGLIMLTLIDQNHIDLLIMDNPFAASDTAVGQGLWMVTEFFPITLVLQHWGMVTAAHFAFMGLSFYGQVTKIPAYVGAFLLLAFPASVNAEKLTIHNLTTNTLEVYPVFAMIAPGQVYSAEFASDWYISISSGTNYVVFPEASWVDALEDFNTTGEEAIIHVTQNWLGTVVEQRDSDWTVFVRGVYLGLGVFGFRLTLYVLRALKPSPESEVV